MKTSKWIKETKNAANDCETNMPWARGLRRQAMIARRLETDAPKAKVSLVPMPTFMAIDLTI